MYGILRFFVKLTLMITCIILVCLHINSASGKFSKGIKRNMTLHSPTASVSKYQCASNDEIASSIGAVLELKITRTAKQNMFVSSISGLTPENETTVQCPSMHCIEKWMKL